MLAPPAPPRIRPSGWWYVLPVVGLVVASVLGVRMVRDAWRESQRIDLVVAPGYDQTITIDEPGGYTVAYFGEIRLQSDEDKEQLAESLRIEIVPSGGGDPLPLGRYEGFRQIESPADEVQYVPLRTVRFDEPGDYVLRTLAQPGLDPERTLVVVTQSPWRQLEEAVRGAVVLFTATLFVGIVGWVILGRTRGRAKRAARAAAPWPPGGGGWPPAPHPWSPGPGQWPPGPPSGPPPGWGAGR